MTLTKQRTIQYIAILLILGTLGAGYFYFSARAGTKQIRNSTSGLVLYWPFNERNTTVIADASGTGNTGTSNWAPSVGGIGRIGTGFQIGGSVKINIAQNGTLFGMNALTVSTWVKLTGYPSAGNNYAPLGKYHTYRFVISDSGAGHFVVATMNNSWYTSGTVANWTTPLSLNQWHLLTGTYDGTTTRMYVDGKLAGTGSQAIGGVIINDGGTLTVNNYGDPNIVDANGAYVDEVRIYNRSLSATEIANLYGFEDAKVNSSVRDSLSEGLSGYWKLDDASGTTATDSSTNGNNGTLTNGPTWGTGQIGGDVDFDGTDDYITTPDASTLDVIDSTNFSLTGWFNRDTFTTDDTIIAKSNGQTAADTGYTLYIDDGTDKLTLAANDGTDRYEIISGSTFTTTGWHHFALSWNDSSSTNTKLYIDGVSEIVSTTGTFANANSLANALTFRIGAESDNGNPFDGKLDEIRLYNRDLSADEVTKLYKTTTPTNPDTRLKGYWSFDGDSLSGTTARDLSGAGNNGTLTNSPTIIEGIHGQAMNFDGTDDHVAVPDSNSLDITGTLTISAWIKPTSVTPIGDKSILRKESGGENYGFVLGGNGDVPSGNLEFVYFSGSWRIIDSGYKVPNTDWHHVVVTFNYSNTSVLFYDNGVLVATKTAPADLTPNTSAVNIGMDMSNKYFSGSIDEVRIYSAALTASEIYNLYQEGSVKVNKAQNNNGDSLNNGLAGYWKLDDASGTTATDSSGNANNGTLTNGPTWGTGQIGGAVTFDGTDDYIDLPNVSELKPTGKFTISSWFKINSTASQAYIFDSYYQNPAVAGIGLALNVEGTTAHKLGVISGRNIGANKCGGTDWCVAIGTTNVDDGTWHFGAGIWDGSYLRIYVDGVLQSSASWTLAPAYSGLNQVRIGNIRQSSDTSYFPGSIDETRLYNRALSAEEISRLYKTTSPTNPETGLVGYWSFNGKDLSGTTTYDRSGKSNNGTLTNGPAITEGKIGQALSFDGVNDYASVSAFDLTGTNKISVAFWLKKSSYANDDQVAIESTTNSNSFSTAILIDPNSAAPCGSFSVTLRGNSANNTACYTRPSAGDWHHYVAIFDKSQTTNEVDLYVDGLLQTPQSRPNTFNNTNNFGNDPWYFMSRAGSSLFSSGSLDEVRIYNRVLSSGEISSLYNFGR